MTDKIRFIAWLVATSFLLTNCTQKKALELPVLTHVLSHNDYEQPNPLFDALDARINCVEVDIAYINETLYVTHAIDEIKEDNTFESLYLKPLRDIIKKNGGFVYKKGVPFTLYINTKTGGKTVEKINDFLQKNSDIIASFTKEGKTDKPIFVICGGPNSIVNTQRFIVAEGHLETPKSFTSSEFYMVNLRWTTYFSWTGEGTFPLEEKGQLLKLVKDTHEQGRILRFWDNPDINTTYGENFWNTILDLGVDIINTDAPKAIKDFFDEKSSKTPKPKILAHPQLVNGHWSFFIETKGEEGDTHYTTDGTSPTVNSPKYIGPVLFSKDIQIKAKTFWKKNGSLLGSKETSKKIKTPVLIPSVKADVHKGALRYYYKEDTSNQLPDLNSLTSKKTDIVNDISDTDFKEDAMYALRYKGYINIPEDGMYTFTSKSTEAINFVLLHDILELENKGHQEKKRTVPLAKGLHPIQVDFYVGLEASFNLQIEGPTLQKQIISSNLLCH
ncbi:FN3 associated domain-containing protein [Flavivirga spongiicola]|uniref:Chitobiase/beta-hexosaminidase C-terminal domain-containing protein n=1 Tax=Flavivirga spongiicola TaxID=421621 RepID=A0ABU7XNL2_9FLAO|nr:FN3 associated domain-containing protein [Flavivirga sp. MEBiC05379]MDO5977349.1 FN3 associated domain-containing protein [Flavivirga sp. MEBiC05379]